MMWVLLRRFLASPRLIGRFVVLSLLATLPGCATTAEDSPARPKCERFIVVPPAHADEKVSDYIALKWLDSVKARLSECYSLVPYAAGKEALLLIGVDHVKRPTTDNFGKTQTERLKDRTGATAVVILGYKVTENKLVVTPMIRDVPTWRRRGDLAEARTTAFALEKNSWRHESSVKRFALGTLNLLPNAFSLGFSGSLLTNRRETDGELRQTQATERTVLPAIVSSLAISSLRHPYTMSLWDFAVDWFGALEFADFNTHFEYTPKSPSTLSASSMPYDLEFFMAVPTINGEIIIHTPLGTSIFALGWGPGIYNYSDSLGNTALGGVSTFRVQENQVVFISEKWFVNLNVSALFPDPPPINNKIFILDNRMYVTLSLGYYFPEVRSLARHLL